MGEITERNKRLEDLRFIPNTSPEKIKENHIRFLNRAALYKEKGVDFFKNRKTVIAKAEPLKGSVLEIGTGNGHTTVVLAEMGYEFASVDVDKNSMKIAALNLAHDNLLSRVTFYVMDGTSLFFNNRTFSNVVCLNLFHHIIKIREMLSEIDRVLKPGGKAIVGDFNEEGMKIVGNVHGEEGNVHEDSGVREEDVRAHFERLGYRITNADDRYHWGLIAEKKLS